MRIVVEIEGVVDPAGIVVRVHGGGDRADQAAIAGPDAGEAPVTDAGPAPVLASLFGSGRPAAETAEPEPTDAGPAPEDIADAGHRSEPER